MSASIMAITGYNMPSGMPFPSVTASMSATTAPWTSSPPMRTEPPYPVWSVRYAEQQTLGAAISHSLTFGIAVTVSVITLAILLRRLVVSLCAFKKHDQLQVGKWSIKRKIIRLFLYSVVLFAFTLAYYLPLIISIAHHKSAAYYNYYYRSWRVMSWMPHGSTRIVSAVFWRLIVVMADSVLACVLHRTFLGHKHIQIVFAALYGAAVLGTIGLLFGFSIWAIIFEIVAFSFLLLAYVDGIIRRRRDRNKPQPESQRREGDEEPEEPEPEPSPRPVLGPVSGVFLLALVGYLICRLMWTLSIWPLGGTELWADALMTMAALCLQHVFILLELGHRGRCGRHHRHHHHHGEPDDDEDDDIPTPSSPSSPGTAPAFYDVERNVTSQVPESSYPAAPPSQDGSGDGDLVKV